MSSNRKRSDLQKAHSESADLRKTLYSVQEQCTFLDFAVRDIARRHNDLRDVVRLAIKDPATANVRLRKALRETSMMGPKIDLASNVVVSDEFRSEFNRWLAETFGYERKMIHHS